MRERDPARAERDQRRANPARRTDHLDAEAEAERPSHPLLGLQGLIGNDAVRALVADEGNPVPDAFRHDMERSFGESFGDVRIHEGSDVDRAVEDIDATALTVGTDVYVHSDAPRPDTPAGRGVLAEELAHVAQGVGTAGAERLLAPGDPVEIEAHRAATAAAAGERAAVRPAPSAVAAGGRLLDLLALGYAGYKYLTEEEEEAKKVELEPVEEDKTAPTPEQVAVIQAGTLPQIDAALKKLADPDVAPMAVAESLLGVGDFLETQQHPSMEGIVVSARQAVGAAISTLGPAVHPEEAIANTATQMRGDAAMLEGLAAGAKEPPAAEGGTPAPAPDALTPQQASMLRSGPIAWLNEAADLLEQDPADVDLAIGKIQGAGGALGAMSVPDAVRPAFNQIRLYCDTYVTRLKATKMSINDAVAEAKSQLGAAKGIIEAMGGEVPPVGGA